MKHLKKWAALLLAFMLMITMVPWTAKAAVPTAADKGTITVKGAPKQTGMTVIAYPITRATYDSTGFTGYEAVSGYTFEDPSSPTAEEWERALKVAEPTNPITLDYANEEWTAAAAPGYYIVKVKGATNPIYNPMLAGVYYTDAVDNSKITNAILELEGNNKNFILDNATLYAKKEAPSVVKKTSDLTPEVKEVSTGDNDALEVPGKYSSKGNGAAFGAPIGFEITSTIPTYPKTDKDLVFKISDKLTGLTLDQTSIKVYVGKNNWPTTQTDGIPTDGTPLDTTKYTVNVPGENGAAFDLSFSSDYLKGLGDKDSDDRSVLVFYTAKISDTNIGNFNAATNEATITYTTDPTTDKTSTSDSNKTYHYTFDIDGLLNGQGSKKTWDVTKHGEEMVDQEQWIDPLQGAEFTLFTDKNATKKAQVNGKDLVATTDAEGRMNFKGLDEGTYYLKETNVPANSGYSVNATIYRVDIKAEYNTDGTLKSYSISIGENDTATLVTKYTKDADGNITGTTGDSATFTNKADEQEEIIDKGFQIKNTKIPGLPSTGGMGTYLFTGIGVALIAGALVLITVLKKKKPQAE